VADPAGGHRRRSRWSASAPPRGRLRLALRAAAVLAAAAFLALLTYGVLTEGDDTSVDDRLRAEGSAPAPALNLPVLQRGDLGPPLDARLRPALADGRLSLRELRGTPVVLNFWASWCDPCRTETPLLQRGWLGARERGVLFLGLDMQDITDDARAFLREFGASYPVVRDRGNDVANRWGVTGLPETFFVSANGRVVRHVVGEVSARQLAEGVAAATRGQGLGVAGGGERRPTR
jgi:cytochrome c biogenesis protein CcmG, thiol:disulfide interchange protein DsbE